MRRTIKMLLVWLVFGCAAFAQSTFTTLFTRGREVRYRVTYAKGPQNQMAH